MKKFFNKLKSDYKFTKAGPGKKVSDQRSPPRSSQSREPAQTSARSTTAGSVQARNNAAEAALARMTNKKPSSGGVNPNTMRRAREEAQKARDEKNFVESLQSPDMEVIEQTPRQSVDGVYYSCPISGDIILKSDYHAHLEEQLNNLSEAGAPLEIAVFKVHCLNTNRGNY